MSVNDHREFDQIVRLMSDAGLRPFPLTFEGNVRYLAIILDRSECQSEWDAACRFMQAALAPEQTLDLSLGEVDDLLEFLKHPRHERHHREEVLYWTNLRWPEVVGSNG